MEVSGPILNRPPPLPLNAIEEDESLQNSPPPETDRTSTTSNEEEHEEEEEEVEEESLQNSPPPEKEQTSISSKEEEESVQSSQPSEEDHSQGNKESPPPKSPIKGKESPPIRPQLIQRETQVLLPIQSRSLAPPKFVGAAEKSIVTASSPQRSPSQKVEPDKKSVTPKRAPQPTTLIYRQPIRSRTDLQARRPFTTSQEKRNPYHEMGFRQSSDDFTKARRLHSAAFSPIVRRRPHPSIAVKERRDDEIVEFSQIEKEKEKEE
jgi:hypothetical protein